MTDYVLSTQQLAVICALSSGATTLQAAEQAGIHRNTIASWRRNVLPFQYALADAQYDRALLYREKAEALADLAIETIQAILTDSNAPAGVRLKAALSILQTASTPPEPKKQITMEIQKVQVVDPPIVHNSAQATPAPVQPEPAASPSPEPQIVHNSAQSCRPAPRTVPPAPGRNEACPCGSGKKYKRCCLESEPAGHRAAAA